MCTFIFKYRQQTTSLTILRDGDEILVSCNTGVSATISKAAASTLDVPDNLKSHLDDSGIDTLYLRQSIVSLLSGCASNIIVVMLIEELIKRVKKTDVQFNINIDIGYKKIKSIDGVCIDLPSRLDISDWDVSKAITDLTG